MQKPISKNVDRARHDFGRNLLGPVVADYLYRLYGTIRFFQDVRKARVLFVSRAGIRIRRALDRFTQTVGLPPIEEAPYLWISRLMVAKGTWRRHRDNAIATLKNEFYHHTLREMAEAMFRHDGLPQDFPQDDPWLERKGSEIETFFSENGPAAQALTAHFEEQSQLFEEYFEGLAGNYDTVLLVDTGWAGTAQRLLAEAWPNRTFWGAYFGRYGFETTNRRYWHNMIGLVFEQDQFEYEKPETCVVLHRHMIEHLFEPHGPSIERLARAEDNTIFAPEAEAVLSDAPTAANDPMFSGVMDYLTDLPDGRSLSTLHAAAGRAWPEIARIVALPTKEETALFEHIRRSADFGKTLMVPLLLPPEDRYEGDSPERRIQDSLWQPGQVAIEYPRDLAEPLQRRIAGLGLFDFKKPWTPPTVNVHIRQRPAVAVITRTLDRPMFLKRALESVAAQTFEDYVHVIVSDGGDIDLVRDTIRKTDCRHNRILLIDNIENRGMEAASNIGIRAVDSDYVVIHDDDDSWEPAFLEKTVAFMDGPKGEIYGGVISKSMYVSEEVTRDGIKIHARVPYHGWVENVHIMEMAIQNFFPPIAFLYKREIYDRIGGYNENYPVLGDWDFNLRFLMEADIGVLPEPLANYHHRDRGNTNLFGNSVIAGRDKHVEYAAIVRNRLTRNALQGDGNSAIAVLVGIGLHLDALRQETRRIQQRTEEMPGMINALANPIQELARKHQSEMERQSEAGLFDADDYWVVMSRLERAVLLKDWSVLRKLGVKDISRGRLFLMKLGLSRKGFEKPPRLSVDSMKFLIQLRKKGYELEPPPDFDEEAYLSNNPDVAAAVAQGKLHSGFEHYYLYGKKEGRKRTNKM